MFEENKAVVAGYLDELRGDTAGLDASKWVTDDVRYIIQGTSPFSGERKGIDEMRAYWKALSEAYAHMEVIEHDVVAFEDGRILGRLQMIGTPRGDAGHYNQISRYIFTIRDGRIADIDKAYEDTLSVVAQVGNASLDGAS